MSIREKIASGLDKVATWFDNVANEQRIKQNLEWDRQQSILSEKEEQLENMRLCPCSKKCCDNCNIYCPNHTCREDICEDCFVSKCRSCGAECVCDL